MAELRQFVEVDTDKALVSVKLFEQHRMMSELVRPKFNLTDFKYADVKDGFEELTLRKMKDVDKRPQWTQRGLIGISGALLWSILTGARCVRRCVMEWIKRIGVGVHVQHLAGGGEEKWASKKMEDHTSLLWKLNEKRNAGDL